MPPPPRARPSRDVSRDALHGPMPQRFSQYAHEAAKLLDEALEGRRRVLGDRHPETLFTMQERAAVARDQGNLEEARKLLELTLEGQRHTFGENHWAVAMTLSDLGNVLRKLGRYPEAGKVLEEALSVAQRLRRRALVPRLDQGASGRRALRKRTSMGPPNSVGRRWKCCTSQRPGE